MIWALSTSLSASVPCSLRLFSLCPLSPVLLSNLPSRRSHTRPQSSSLSVSLPVCAPHPARAQHVATKHITTPPTSFSGERINRISSRYAFFSLLPRILSPFLSFNPTQRRFPALLSIHNIAAVITIYRLGHFLNFSRVN
ncbi:hypothetical protein BDQ17DRAFT_8979 [Cyathus striatus]|nr:hypothetical protein BDQ17DRAFT_8979 [Cyathus striatus]